MLGAGALAAGLSLAFASRGLAQAPNITPPATKKVPAPPAKSKGKAKTKAKTAPPPASTPNQALIDAAKRCGRVGDVCLRHCIRLTRAGDTSIADCMRAVRAMLPVCAAIAQLASQDAKRLKEMAKLCADVCSDCEDECRKHEFHHFECKTCAEACAAMITECKAVIGA